MAIARPAIGTIKGDSFVGQLRQWWQLTGGEFTQGESRYALPEAFTKAQTVLTKARSKSRKDKSKTS